MNTNVAMGLRADQAREILVNNGYDQKVYFTRDFGSNDAHGYLLAITAGIGAGLCTYLDKAFRWTASWMNVPSYSAENPEAGAHEQDIPIVPIFFGAALGLALPILLLSRADANRESQAKRINAVRMTVMGIIDGNYRECDFHSPLKGSHITELLNLLDEKTQKQFLNLMNEVQTAEALGKDSKSENFTTKTLWERNTEFEVKLWADFRHHLGRNNENEIKQSYLLCKNEFGQKIADGFVKNYTTPKNLKTVHNLSDTLEQFCKEYYEKHKKVVDSENYFK